MSDKKTNTGAYIVTKGATCLCDKGTVMCPLQINNTKYHANSGNGDKPIASQNENQFTGVLFGNCSLQKNDPCNYLPGNFWKSPNSSSLPLLGIAPILTDDAQMICPVKSGKITVLTHGQQMVVKPKDIQDFSVDMSNNICALMSTEEAAKSQVKFYVKSLKYNDIYSTEKKDKKDSEKIIDSKEHNSNKKLVPVYVPVGKKIDIKAFVSDTKQARKTKWSAKTLPISKEGIVPMLPNSAVKEYCMENIGDIFSLTAHKEQVQIRAGKEMIARGTQS